jgi:hypothetical protein
MGLPVYDQWLSEDERLLLLAVTLAYLVGCHRVTRRERPVQSFGWTRQAIASSQCIGGA